MKLLEDNTLSSINIDVLKECLEKFKESEFLKLNYDERKSAIMALSIVICRQFDMVTISTDNFDFLSGENFTDSSARYDPVKCKIGFNKDLIASLNIDYIDIFCILDNTFHETTHYIQDKLGNFKEELICPFEGKPYYVFQDSEIDAYSSSWKILERIDSKKYVDFDIGLLLSAVKAQIDLYEDKSKNDLASRGYSNNYKDIKAQMKEIFPFYKDYDKFFKFREDDKIDKTNISIGNVKIEIIKDDDNWLCDIAVRKMKGIDHLYCRIGEMCKVNEIHKEMRDGHGESVDDQGKQYLMGILNKIIAIYNEKHKLNKCTNVEITPISIFDKKSDYDVFLNTEYSITPVDEPAFPRSIPINKIRKQCEKLDNLDGLLGNDKNSLDDSESTVHNVDSPDINR